MGAVGKYFSNVYSGLATALIGMATTGRNAFRRPVTLEYPDVRWEIPERFRGILHNRIEDCIGCQACVRACPVNCISIETVKRAKEDYGTTSGGSKIVQWVARYDIDEALCMFCGLCVESCPTGCLTMTDQYELSVHSRRGMYLSFALEEHKRKAGQARAAKAAEVAEKQRDSEGSMEEKKVAAPERTERAGGERPDALED